MIKLIVCDLDGTLLDSHQQLSDYNVNMLKEAQENGIEFMVATGRNMRLIRPFLQKYGLKCGCILLNGAEVRDKEERILSTINVSKSVIRSLHIDLVSRGYMPFYNTDKNIIYAGEEEEFRRGIGYRQKCLDRTCKDFSDDEAIEQGMKSSYAKEAERIDSIETLISNDRIEVRKIVVFHSDVKKNIETIKYLEDKYDNLAVGASYPEDIEINDQYAQKGYGLIKAITSMDISKNEVAVFGDGMNDVSMFREFPNSYAPINAVPTIKTLAHTIIPSNDEDGVGKTIDVILSSRKGI